MALMRKTNHLFHYYVVIHRGHTVRKIAEMDDSCLELWH